MEDIVQYIGKKYDVLSMSFVKTSFKINIKIMKKYDPHTEMFVHSEMLVEDTI